LKTGFPGLVRTHPTAKPRKKQTKSHSGYGNVVSVNHNKGGNLPKFDLDVLNKGGMTLSKKEHHEDTQRLLLEYLLHNGEDTESWYKAAFLAIELQRYHNALFYFEILIELNPLDSKAWSMKGYVLNCMGDAKEAVNAYDKAISILCVNISNKRVRAKGVDRV